MSSTAPASSPALADLVKEVRATHPNLPEALVEPLAKVQRARRLGLLPEARVQLDQLLREHPGRPAFVREDIRLRVAAEEFDEARQLLESEAARVPGDPWVWTQSALVAARRTDARMERLALERALAIRMDEGQARRVFELQRDDGDLAAALDTVLRLRALRDTDELAAGHCRLLAKLDRDAEALALCESLIERDTPLLSVVDVWSGLLAKQPGGLQLVLERCRERRARRGDEAPVLMAEARALHRMERPLEASALMQRAVEMKPDDGTAWYDLGVQQRQAGLVAESQASLDRAMALRPGSATTLRVFGVEHKYQYGDHAWRRVSLALAQAGSLDKADQVELHYAAGKAHEDVGDLDAAFAHYEVAGRKQAEITPYRHAASLGLLRTLRQGMRPETYAKFAEPGHDSTKPVFVLGMPRSGTTLTEQIIASHPDAHGAGELKVLSRVLDGVVVNSSLIESAAETMGASTWVPGGVDLDCRKLRFAERGVRYVEAITALAQAAGRPDAKRVVDKMPGNYFWTGLIPLILPNARIVHTRRHPMDTCLSNYRIFFPDGMPWSYDLRALGQCYRAYHEHMQHWERNLPPGVLISVRYEDMVADTERQARRVLEHVGLPWDERCLRFYENGNAVKTASLTQVRKPIYASSVGRWRRFERFLQPLIQELGPLVDAYEQELQQAEAERARREAESPVAPADAVAALA
jgi:tetratricopeptide (TPR) repeat protein